MKLASMYRHDSDWFNSQMNSLEKGVEKGFRRPSIDWHDRDLVLSSKVPQIRKELESDPGPVRPVTKSRILRALCYNGVLISRYNLPLTTSAIAAAVE